MAEPKKPRVLLIALLYVLFALSKSWSIHWPADSPGSGGGGAAAVSYVAEADEEAKGPGVEGKDEDVSAVLRPR